MEQTGAEEAGGISEMEGDENGDGSGRRGKEEKMDQDELGGQAGGLYGVVGGGGGGGW